MPTPGTDEHREVVSAFYSGVAAMEVGEDLRANAKLTYVTELAPREPAAWANLGLMALRRNETDQATEHLNQALSLDEENSYVLYLLGLLHLREGQTDQGQEYLRRAAQSEEANLRAAYTLWESLGAESDEARAQLEALRQKAPDNLVLLVAALEAQFNASAVDSTLRSALESRMAIAGDESLTQLSAAYQAYEQQDAPGAVMQLRFLRNLLLTEPTYRQDLAELRAPIEVVASPLGTLQSIEMPQATPAPRDDSLQFLTERLLADAHEPKGWIGGIALGNDALPAVFFADGDTLSTLRGEAWAFPGVPGPHAVAGIDYNFDFRTDLALVGSEGLRLVVQDSLEAFHDVTHTLGLSSALLAGPYTGAWAADLDLEGDVDLILAGSQALTLRNNGDGTFVASDIFAGLPAPKNFAWADLDQDGDPDAAWTDHDGQLHLLQNERQGRFVEWEGSADLPGIEDLAVSDTDSDGAFDLVLLAQDGRILRLAAGLEWTVEDLGQVGEGFTRLLLADLDNSGGQDIVVSGMSGSHVLLQHDDYAFYAIDGSTPIQTFGIASVGQAGRLDLLGLDAEGQPARAQVLSFMGYHWKQIRSRAAQAVGDQRINSFGIGGEVELRAGMLYQKQPITQPIVHFGLGHYLLADVARITWPNGSVQAEFDLQSDQVISAQQRLKGSCPWLFAHNGEEVAFVTDFIWRSPLGLRINAQETAGVMTTEDWVKVSGDQLSPVNGHYDLRITAELWETHFFDQVSLLVVDHAEDTEIFIDERFAFPPPELAVHVTRTPQPVARVVTDAGSRRDGPHPCVRDEEYLDFFGRGDYQGITRDHYVEIDLGDTLPDAAYLVASGWIRPTDSSINVAISHGQQAPPRPLRLEVLSADGTWTTAYPNLGFPSGKAKTVLIDLEGIFEPGVPRRVRLHTNLEIYWDALMWAEKMQNNAARVTRLQPTVADLRYRGYSLVTEANKSSPELPTYGTLSGTVPIWRDLVGYYTRFGEVGRAFGRRR